MDHVIVFLNPARIEKDAVRGYAVIGKYEELPAVWCFRYDPLHPVAVFIGHQILERNSHNALNLRAITRTVEGIHRHRGWMDSAVVLP